MLQKEKLEEEKVGLDFLAETDRKTEELLTSLLNSIGYTEAIIKFY